MKAYQFRNVWMLDTGSFTELFDAGLSTELVLPGVDLAGVDIELVTVEGSSSFVEELLLERGAILTVKHCSSKLAENTIYTKISTQGKKTSVLIYNSKGMLVDFNNVSANSLSWIHEVLSKTIMIVKIDIKDLNINTDISEGLDPLRDIGVNIITDSNQYTNPYLTYCEKSNLEDHIEHEGFVVYEQI